MKKLFIILTLILPTIFSFAQDTIELEETIIVATNDRENFLRGLSLNKIELNLEALSKMPTFLGISDPLKIVQLLPGIQTSGDGNSGLFVRGGEPGHNIVLWNDAPIYNSSHFSGAFSVFNTSHISSFKLYKSHLLPQNTGRLSSVIEVVSPNDTVSRFSAEGTVGLCLSQATLSIPLTKKISLFLSGRITYMDLLINPLIKKTWAKEKASEQFDYLYSFNDINATVTARPSSKDKLVFNFYRGADDLDMIEERLSLNSRIKWSNMVVSGQWFHSFDNVEAKNSIYFSRYTNSLKANLLGMSLSLPSSIEDIGYKGSFRFYIANVSCTAGMEYAFHNILPQAPALKTETNFDTQNPIAEQYHSHEAALHFNGKIYITNHFSANVGLRYTLFGGDGAFFHGIDPRVLFEYSIDRNNTLQASYNFVHQYLNMVTFSTIGLPIDFYIPSTKGISPQKAHNFSIGYHTNILNNQYEFSIEPYYRKLYNQIEFAQTLFDLFAGEYNLENSLYFGSGNSFGAEIMAKKNKGRLTGWLSYTISRTTRNFPDIDEGKTFPARFDRTHDISLALSYFFNQKWDASAVFVYATGGAYTDQTGFHFAGGNLVREYGSHNGARIPDYHRLDLAVNYWFKKTKNRHSCISLSVYNVYKHSNPIYPILTIKENPDNSEEYLVYKNYRKLYDIIPSLSYTFKF